MSQYFPDFRKKVQAIPGDLIEPKMGISPQDELQIIENVNVVFHSAATVRFDEPLKYFLVNYKFFKYFLEV